jgi:hypothetical protein
MSNNNKEQKSPPEIGPYVFPTLLAIFGLWFLYDGWFTSNPEMQEHQLFNRIGSLILLPWAIIDFIRTWRIEKAANSATTVDERDTKDDSQP